jgi:charged multivesicular body protein 7
LNSPQWGRPLALGAVIQDAVEKREFVPLDDFLNATKSIYAKSWIPSPWQVVSWGLKQVGVASLFGASDKLSVGNLVVMANVEVILKHPILEPLLTNNNRKQPTQS